MARRGRKQPEFEREIEALRSALARERHVSRALLEVGSAVGATDDLDEILELILARVTELLDADRATLYLVDESRGELVSRIVIGQRVRSIKMKIGHGIAGMVARTGKPLRVRDAYSDPRFEQEWDVLTGYRTTSMLTAPLKATQGRIIGVIQVLNKRGTEGFGEDDEAVLMALGTQAAMVVDKSRLLLSLVQNNAQLEETTRELENRVSDLQILLEVEHETARAVTLEDLVKAALRAALRASDARAAALLLALPETGDLVLYLLDSRREGLRCVGVKSGEGILAHAMTLDGVLVIDEVPSHPAFSAAVDGSLGFEPAAALALALDGDEGRALGALGVFSERDESRVAMTETKLLPLLAANVSTALRLHWASVNRERGERLAAIGRLLSQVIHDFKTPMTVISGYVQLMAGIDDPVQRAVYVEKILKHFDLLAGMQREVLEFARGERTLFVRRVYLHRFFQDLRQQIEHELEGKPIELLLDVDTKAVARFDEARLSRALHNLARNAIEAMAEEGGKLGIQARLEGPELVVKVTDTGPGIPAEIATTLFQSFVTAGKRGGTGLGLAIVKKIVEEHGGSVSVRSSSGGATFEVRLPQPGAKRPAELADATPGGPARPTQGTPGGGESRPAEPGASAQVKRADAVQRGESTRG